jgi:thioredoxin reductase
MIVGGRQSAYEWAALLADGDAEEIHVVHRHDTPQFTASDWHFVDRLMDLTATVPGWFRNLSPEEREAIAQRLSTGERLAVDHVVLATGYKADMREVPYLSGVVDALELADGFPVLDDHFQSSLPGLFVTGFPATRDFGSFFGFVRGCPVAAKLTTAGLTETLGRAR